MGEEGCQPQAMPWTGQRAIPRTPVLSADTFLQRGEAEIPCLLDVGLPRFFAAGRYALLRALQDAAIGAGDAVLVPAYHCGAMIAPILEVGAIPVFYPLEPDLSIDPHALTAKLTAAVRALIAVHYFGFVQDMAALRRFSDDHGLCLIEDCAHAFFGTYGAKPVGWHGDYAIGSIMKFFPTTDGGCLISRRHEPAAGRPLAAGLRRSTKAAVNTLEYALDYRRMGPAASILKPLLSVKDRILARNKKERSAYGEGDTVAMAILPDESDENDLSLDASLFGRSATLPAKLTVAAASRSRIVERRRANFLRILSAVQGLPDCRPLFPRLPEGVVPWVFPIVFDDVAAAYARLDRQGVPIPHFGKNLWHGMNPAVCGVSLALSKNCLQFPCHQELQDQELQWLIDRIVGAMQRTARL